MVGAGMRPGLARGSSRVLVLEPNFREVVAGKSVGHNDRICSHHFV
jgi:hypothetical protein